MHFPSLNGVARQLREMLNRFPLPALAALLATGVAVSLVERPTHPWQPRMLAAAMLGLTLSTALTITTERRETSRVASPAGSWKTIR